MSSDPKNPPAVDEPGGPRDAADAEATHKRLRHTIDQLNAKLERGREAAARLKDLQRSYYFSGFGKKIDISQLPGFSTVASQVIAEHRAGMNYDRLYTLWQAVSGSPDAFAVAEVGSYKGGSSKFIAETLRMAGRAPRFYVCDTFQGHARLDPEIDGVEHDEGFKDTSAESVAAYLSAYPNVQLVVGDIVETSEQLTHEPAFAFVHIDVDVYPATDFCLRFFASRLAPGGMIVVDDYGVITCPGAQKAVDDFAAAHTAFRKFHFLSGQALILRVG